MMKVPNEYYKEEFKKLNRNQKMEYMGIAIHHKLESKANGLLSFMFLIGFIISIGSFQSIILFIFVIITAIAWVRTDNKNSKRFFNHLERIKRSKK